MKKLVVVGMRRNVDIRNVERKGGKEKRNEGGEGKEEVFVVCGSSLVWLFGVFFLF